jgi:hypothetical protein
VNIRSTLATIAAAGLLLAVVCPQAAAEQAKPGGTARLAVIWSSADAEVAHKVCLMYAHAAKTQKWFDEVVLILWGPSSRLLAADKDLQAKVKSMQADGIRIEACLVCADSYGVTETLRGMGIKVHPMGKPLTEMLKEDWKVLTF